ncbi:MAG: ADP-ribosylglycohydrolase family protein, partial [Gammaproteobacteria bacterium]|nr:ADP-ribosylglycohydrolase family protein [Gammaproteobacteria bacterium]
FPKKSKDFYPLVSRFTDDTVLTVSVASAILNGTDYAETIKEFALRYPRAGYGGAFRKWILQWENKPYNSWGNGSAMRVSSVGFAYDTEAEVLEHAKRTAEVSHNHPEGIKGAQATALAIFMSRQGAAKEDIRQEVTASFDYDLDRTVDEIRPGYRFDVSCMGSVPESIISFLDSDSFMDAIRNAISLGGDADTMACIAGGIAQAYYKEIPEKVVEAVREKLDPELRKVVDQFNETFGCEF